MHGKHHKKHGMPQWIHGLEVFPSLPIPSEQCYFPEDSRLSAST